LSGTKICKAPGWFPVLHVVPSHPQETFWQGISQLESWRPSMGRGVQLHHQHRSLLLTEPPDFWRTGYQYTFPSSPLSVGPTSSFSQSYPLFRL
jgi:hypothetical protein